VPGLRLPALRVLSDNDCSLVQLDERSRMAIKDNVIKAIQALPDDATLEEINERFNFVLMIERRFAEMDAGNEISDKEARKRLERWLE
jgi:hypothetical protein